MSKTLIAVVAMLLLAAGIVAAQTRPVGRGYHVVTLPTEPGWGHEVDSQVLLETTHLKLTAITMPAGSIVPIHSASSQVTIQALSGHARVRLTGIDTVVPLDHTRLLVLAPWMRHEIVTGRREGAVVLVHQILSSPRRGRRY